MAEIGWDHLQHELSDGRQASGGAFLAITLRIALLARLCLQVLHLFAPLIQLAKEHKDGRECSSH